MVWKGLSYYTDYFVFGKEQADLILRKNIRVLEKIENKKKGSLVLD